MVETILRQIPTTRSRSKGSVRRSARTLGEKVYVRGRCVGQFLRTIPPPDEVNADEARAVIRDGALESWSL
jgi:HSP20 family molecular chaperone IbpA